MTQKEKISEILVVAAIAAFGYWRYSKLSGEEKERIHADIKGIGENVMKELLPQGVKTLLPSIFK